MMLRIWGRSMLVAMSVLFLWTGQASATVEPAKVSTVDIAPHLDRLQEIADHNGGNRAFGTGGFAKSLSYVRGELDRAGFRTHLENFEHNGKTGHNLIAEWPGGDAHQTIFLGAHLDSVAAAPGLNDNGSGVAALLATALGMAKSDAAPDKYVRFAFWGAEEQGLVGSTSYVNSLTKAERDDIAVYLNFDMVGTKNPKQWMLIDTGAPASDVVQRYFDNKNIPTLTVGAGGSDHVPFDAAGVPVAGFTTGLGSCYHKPCDDRNNVGPQTEEISTKAIERVLAQLAEIH